MIAAARRMRGTGSSRPLHLLRDAQNPAYRLARYLFSQAARLLARSLAAPFCLSAACASLSELVLRSSILIAKTIISSRVLKTDERFLGLGEAISERRITVRDAGDPLRASGKLSGTVPAFPNQRCLKVGQFEESHAVA